MLQLNKVNFKSLANPYFLLIFSAVLLSTLTDQYVQKKVEFLISSKDGLTSELWLWGALSIVTAVLFPLIISLLCAFVLVIGNKKLSQFLSENLELGLVETLRAWGKTFLWSLLFIFPGIVKYINYILTPFVVAFSERYKNGEVDALEYSTQISKNFWWSIKIWLGVFYVLIPVILYFLLDEYRTFNNHPISATAVVFLETVFELVFHYILLKLFIKYLNASEVSHVTHV